MAILSDADIRAQLVQGRLQVVPLGEHAIQPSSIDLRLGPDLLIATPDGFQARSLLDGGPYHLHHGTFLLAATLERIDIPNDLVGVLSGKSSRAREGIQVEAAGYVDPGWRGNLTLEIVMLSRMSCWLTLGMPIVQLRLEPLTSPCERPYGTSGLLSHYQDSKGPVPSRASTGRPS